MFGNHFYNASIRKTVIAFGSLFNDIRIKRPTESREIRVPLSYGPKEKFYQRINSASSISDDTRVAITLPYLGFDITNIAYDPTRKRNTMLKRYGVKSGTADQMVTSFAEIPYNIDFSLYAFARNMDDMLQIVEQIVPYFTPEFSVSLNFNEVAQKIDVPIILNAVTPEDDYEGDFETRRTLIYTFNFTIKTFMYGKIKDSQLIKTVQTKIRHLEALSTSFVAGSTTENEYFYTGYANDSTIVGPTGALSRVDVSATGDSENFTTETDIYVRREAAGLSAGPWFIDVFGNTSDYGT